MLTSPPAATGRDARRVLPRGRRPTRALVACAAAGAILVGAGGGGGGEARSAPRAEDLRAPRNLTVALSDELLGQLAPDERHLYFVSNRNATTQIFHQDLTAPASTLLFDEAADVTGPRVSPDGKQLAYVSFREEANGQLCVRELVSPSEVGERRCLDGGGALEAVWSGAGELLVLDRESVDEDLRLLRVRTGEGGAHLRATTLLARNLTGPTVSPDGRWLLFVPLARAAGRLGPAFAAQAARELVLRRLDTGAEAKVRIELPGISGQPSFSPDSRWVYFTQFLDDDDQNGRVDADDHGVVFRVPFDGARGDGAASLVATAPEQVTSGAWNCQYPTPSRTRVVLTCARNGSLDLYSLPLDGVLPEGWTPGRVRDELAASRDPWDHLLLLRRLARATTSAGERATLLLEMVRVHLRIGEYEAGLDHVRRIGRLAREGAPAELTSLAPILELLIAQRSAMRAFDRGQTGQRVLDDTRARLAAVQATVDGEPAAATALRQIVASELLDVLGDKQAAAQALERARVDARTPAFVVELRAARAESLYRALDDAAALGAALRPIVDHPSLPAGEQLRLGGVYARTIVRGLSRPTWTAAVERELGGADPRSVRAFALELERCLADVTPDTLAAARACVNPLYERNPSLDRRRALVTAVVNRAELTNADDLEYELLRRWVADVPPDSAEMRPAEYLYRHVAEDYGYDSLAEGRYADAIAEFEPVMRLVESLESHIGFIESSLAAGKSEAELERTYAARYPEGAPARHFARAYLGLRRLHDLDGEAFDRDYPEVLAEVAAVEQALPQKCEVQALHATLLHLRYLRTHELPSAEEAATHYLLALDLAHKSARYRAMVLEQLALLHGQVGNYRIAIGYFDDRAAMPFNDARVELGHHLARARALAHAGRDADAAKGMEAALSLVERTPSLARFLPLALDRAGLYALAAGDGARATQHYDRLEKLGEASEPGWRERNRVVLWLARAAAVLAEGKPAEALANLTLVDQALVDPRVRAALDWPDVTPEEVRRSYDLLRLGLRAQAETALGRLDDAQRTRDARHALLLARVKERALDEDVLALALEETQLADLARARRRLADAGHLASLALAHAGDVAKRTATPLADAHLAVLRFAVELHLVGGVALASFDVDLVALLRTTYDLLCHTRDPSQREIRHRFGVYLTLLGLDRPR